MAEFARCLFLVTTITLLAGCTGELSVTVINEGSETIWVQPAEIMGYDVTPGIVAPGTGKTTFLTGTERLAGQTKGSVCWRPYDRPGEEKQCVELLITAACLPEWFRQGRDDLEIRIADDRVSVGVRQEDAPRDEFTKTTCDVRPVGQ